MSNTNITTVSNTGDKIKITLAVLILAIGIFAYSYFSDLASYARVGIFVGSLVLAAILVWLSDLGKRGLAFATGSYNEMKRVVWPSRKEVIQMTGVVFAFVFVMSIFLWIADSLIDWILYGVFLGWKQGELVSKRWYVLHVFSGMEKRVQKSLQERIAEAGLDSYFGRILVPSEEVMESRAGHKSISERRIFPGYVFIEMELTDETWHLVKSTNRVTGFLGGTGNRPTPISEKEVNKILFQIEEGGEKPRPKVLFEVGEMLRVKEGPFADFNGTVEAVNYERSKVQVNVTIFGRITPVELDFSQVEKA